MSAAIIVHHYDPSHAAAVAKGEAVGNPADLLPGDVLLSCRAPGRLSHGDRPSPPLLRYLVVEYETGDGNCGTLNVRPT